jgi:nitroreductase
MTELRSALVPQLLAEARKRSLAAPATPGAPSDPYPEGGRLWPLPAPSPPSVNLETALRGRTAVRQYARSPLALDDVAALAAAATGADRRGWPAEHAAVPLDILIASWRVMGAPPALARYDADAHALVRLGELPTGKAAEDLVLQREFAHAPAVALVTGDLRTATARRGAHGHRLLLLRAGAACQAMWLAALRRALVGSIFAGLLPDALRDIGGVDGYSRAALLALAVGRPAQPPDSLRDTSGRR